MSRSLRTLIVEDSEEDTLLILHALRRGGWEVAHKRVDTAAAMSQALDTQGWDVIIADFSLPQFSGPAALALAVARGSDLPFILISGVVGEEMAVQSMKAGADDYISKNSLARLAPAVDRELQKANERRQARLTDLLHRKREVHLADALHLARVGTWHVDLATDAAVWSDEACRIIGCEGDRGEPAFDELLGRLRAADRDALAALLRHPDTKQFSSDFQMDREDGGPQFVHIRGDVIRDSNQVAIAAAGTIQDRTEQKLAEIAFSDQQARFQTTLSSIGEAVIVTDLESRITFMNRTAEKLTGWTHEEAFEKPLADVFSIVDETTSLIVQSSLERVIPDATVEGLANHMVLVARDGVRRPIEHNAAPILDAQGDNLGVVLVFHDVSKRKLVERELAAAMGAAEAANRSKSEFLANMSHEIRTPMTAILGFTEMLLTRSEDESAKLQCVQTIRRNASHLLELINEILDLSKIEAGQMTVEHIQCDLPVLLSEIASLMRPRAEEKGLAFEITFAGRIPRFIKTDPTRLRQILVNLLGNAMKFTKTGSIAIRVAEEGGGGPRLKLRVDVVDTGIGMTPELLQRLFRPFTQGDESITRKFGGTGLGLTISRRLALLLHGDIEVVSSPDLGSTFTLTIDGGLDSGVERLHDLTEATLPALTGQDVPTDIRLSGRILLVEDGRDNQRLLTAHLIDAGAEVVCVENGLLAVEIAAAQVFDLILMDMQMPVMDGYAATRALRDRGATLPIIALTAYAMAEDRMKCMASGCSDYLTKPVVEEVLLRTVNLHLGSAVAGRGLETASSEGRHEPSPTA
jgi:PAS domain S-box-containing protein